MPSSTHSPIKKVIIVGAGLGGLALAVLLRQHGIQVQILEKAHVLGEVGAAISVAPNCTRILQSLDFDPILAETTNTGPFYEYNEEGEVVDYYNLEELSKASGAPWWYLHRADFHSELVRLATKAEKAGWAPPAVMNLDCHIVGCDPEAGSVVDKNGKVYSADVIVGSDGVHSATRSSVTGNEGKSVYSGHSAFRWLWDVEELKKDEDPEIREFVNEVKMEDYVGKDGRRCLIYPCRANKLLNLFAPVPMPATEAVESWRATGQTETLVEAFSEFPHRLRKLLAKTSNPPLWQIRDREPFQGWSRGKAILIGDAAHPMLPHQGQGGAQAIEDAAALAVFLTTGDLPLSRRLEEYEKFRWPRVSAVQKRSREQKEGPHERECGLKPSIEIWKGIGKLCAIDVAGGAKEWIEGLKL